MRSLPLLLAIALTGCAQGAAQYPSLLPRPIESQSLAEPERPVPVATPDAALNARLATIQSSLEESRTRFNAAAQTAEAKIAVARGLPVGSDPWLTAQVALSEAESARAPARAAQSDLEQMVIERGAAGLPPYPALEAAVAAAAELSAAQDARLSALQGALAT